MNKPGTVRLQISGHRSGPCLVLGNALGTDVRIWAAQERELSPHLCIVRFELPGHGGADEFAYRSIAGLAGALLTALDHEGISRFAYAGLSMGGALGLELARLAPERLRAMALSNTAAAFGPSEFWEGRIAQAQTRGVASLARAAVSRWLTPAFTQSDPETATLLQDMFSSTSLTGYVQACRAIRDFDAREWLSSIGVPTLIVAGADDEATPPVRSEELHRAILNSSYLRLPAAHLANIDCPTAFTAAVAQFLAPYTLT